MRLIDPYLDIPTYKKIMAKYGGEYSFFDRLRMGGIGSPKVTYVSGIKEFDEIHYSDDLEHSITNFELIKAGLIIRINKRQNLAIAIEHFNLLQIVELKSEPIIVHNRLLKEGRLILQFENSKPLIFKIGPAVFDGVLRFFKKPVFANVFRLI